MVMVSKTPNGSIYRRWAMRTHNLIWAFLLALVLASCRALPQQTPEAEEPGEPSPMPQVTPTKFALPEPDLSPLSPLPTPPGGESDPDSAFKQLWLYLIQMYPGFGLDQQETWTPQDITKAALIGTSTWAWRSGEWTLEMTFPAMPEPSYEAVLFHQQAGTVWRGTLEPNGQIEPAHTPLSLSFSIGASDQAITSNVAQDWVGVEIHAEDGIVHLKHNLWYVCCAEIELAIGQDGNVIRVIETNVGDICSCMAGYPITIRVRDLSPGAYTVEVWGVQYDDVHTLELFGRGEVTIP
jgi:hypothetical protein